MRNKALSKPYLPHPVYDSHFHALHMFQKGLDAQELLSEAFSLNLRGAMEVAVDENNFQKRMDLAKKFPQLRLSAGIHPSSSDGNDWNQRFKAITEQCSHPSVRAIGETGLDFFRNRAAREIQEKSFRAHLELSRQTRLPVIIHNRDADTEVLSLVREVKPSGGIFHCFSSGWETAGHALDLGFHISFSGNISYKNADEIRVAAKKVPLNRLLVETDAPFLTPQPVRGRPNHPGYIGYTLETLAEIRGESQEQLAEAVCENAFQLFGHDGFSTDKLT